jgi:hypothetical protein
LLWAGWVRPPLGDVKGTKEVLNPLNTPENARVPKFDDFWTLYPRKCAKADAEKAFRRITWTADLWATVMAALRRQRKSEQWKEGSGRFIPYPATWLRGYRWEDELVCEEKADPCGWPGCEKFGVTQVGSRKYCPRHEAALVRGETPRR